MNSNRLNVGFKSRRNRRRYQQARAKKPSHRAPPPPRDADLPKWPLLARIFAIYDVIVFTVVALIGVKFLPHDVTDIEWTLSIVFGMLPASILFVITWRWIRYLLRSYIEKPSMPSPPPSDDANEDDDQRQPKWSTPERFFAILDTVVCTFMKPSVSPPAPLPVDDANEAADESQPKWPLLSKIFSIHDTNIVTVVAFIISQYPLHSLTIVEFLRSIVVKTLPPSILFAAFWNWIRFHLRSYIEKRSVSSPPPAQNGNQAVNHRNESKWPILTKLFAALDSIVSTFVKWPLLSRIFSISDTRIFTIAAIFIAQYHLHSLTIVEWLRSIVLSTIPLSLLFVSIWRWLRFHLRAFIDVHPLPAGPWTIPLLGSLGTISYSEPHKTILYWKNKSMLYGGFGQVFTIATPQPVVVICGYEELRIASHRIQASGRPTGYRFRVFMQNKNEGNGFILSYGETWKKSKEFTAEHFKLHGVYGEGIMRVIEEYGEEMLGHFEAAIGGAPTHSAVFDPHSILAHAIGGIIFLIVLGRRYQLNVNDARMKELQHLIDQVIQKVQSVDVLIADSCPWLENILPADRQYQKLGRKLQEFFWEEIAENKRILEGGANTQGIAMNNLIAMFINAKPDALVNGEIDANFLAGDVWTGGMETTLTAIRWAIIFFCKNPHVQEKLHDEVIKVYPRFSTPTFQWDGHEHRLPYLAAVTDEILRLGNILPWNIPHMALDTFDLNGHVIEKGTELMLSYASIHHDPSLFADPYQFLPERFLRTTPTPAEVVEWREQGKNMADFAVFERSPYVLPFGLGHRRCPGEKLARKELLVFIIILIQRYRFSEDDAHPISTGRRMGMTSVPYSYKCRVERRMAAWYDKKRSLPQDQ